MLGTSDGKGRHFFERAEDLDRFLAEMRTGEISLKWAYSGSAAGTHDELGKSEGYNANSDASLLEATLLRDLLGIVGSAVDVGPGNSMHTHALWERIPVDQRPSRYLLLDFSRELMRICGRRLGAAGGALAATVISEEQWDFESGATPAIDKWRSDGPLVALLIGHTLGNPLQPRRVLLNLRESIRPKDKVILSVSLRGDDEETLNSYNSSSVFRIAATEPFRMAGFDIGPDDLRLVVDKQGTIVGSVTVGLRADAAEATNVTCFRSRRFTTDHLLEMVEGVGFRVSAVAEDAGHAALSLES